MPTTAVIIQNTPVAIYLAANAIEKNQQSGRGFLDPNLAIKIRIIYRFVKKIYDSDPNYAGLFEAANYMWELTGVFGITAMAITGTTPSGGEIAPVSPSGISYPFYITSANFQPDGVTYLNTKIAGTNIALFINEYNQQFFPGEHFTYVPSGGFIITAPGFDANNFQYTIRVEKYYAIPI